jgi:ABC-type methionine transport system ATPase subunit
MADARVTLKVSELSLRIGERWLLDGVSFNSDAGTWTLVYGPSGSGKSTLLRAINGLLWPTRGAIWAMGTAIPGRSRRQARAIWRQTGTVLQEVALFETKTALQNVALALRTVGADRASARLRATSWLDRLQLGDKLHEYPGRLSGGERQRVALARAFAVQPRLLLLDEPTSALDHATARIALEAVQELAAHGTTVVMSSHRVDEIVGMCDQRIALHNGHVSHIERHPTWAGRLAMVEQQEADRQVSTERGKIAPS